MELVFHVLISAFILGIALSSDGPPNISVTFTAEGEVEHHLSEETRFGQFMLGVDNDKKRSYQVESYDILGKRVVNMIFHIDNVTCYVRNGVCMNETRNPKEPPNFWKWLQLDSASNEGTVNIRHINYDFWGYNVGGLRLEVAVDGDKPQYFNRKTAEDSVNYSFRTFKSDTPPPNSMYAVPQYCWPKN